MLILKSIELASCRPFLTATQSFPERLIGNYTLGGASFTPKELFFLLGADPQQLPEVGGMTTVVANTQLNNSSTVTMEVVNNLLNRIMLLDSPSFTYQDSVYLTAVLNKLGITNTQQFVKEARELLQESSAVVTLLRYYRENAHTLRSQAQPQAVPPQKRSKGRAKAAGPPALSQPTYYLQEEIYNRLGTAQIYQSLSRISQNAVAFSEQSLHQSLLFAEQHRVSSLMLLNEQRRDILHELLPLTLLQQGNDFERGENLPLPKTEQDIYAQATAAAMLSAVQHLTVQRFATQLRSGVLWVDISRVIAQTVQNSFKRYELYHSGSDQYRTEHNAGHQLLLQELQQFAQYTDSSSYQQIAQLQLQQRQGQVEPAGEQFFAQPLPPPPELPDFSPAELALLQEGAEPDGQQLVEQLRQIDAQNRKRQTELQQRTDHTEVKRIGTGADIDRTKRDALRALEQPEQVFAELMQQATQGQQVRPRFTPEVELLLNSTDETTRTLLETVLLQEQGIRAPGGFSQELHPGNQGMLNAEGQRQKLELQELMSSGQLQPEPPPSESDSYPGQLQQMLHRTTTQTERSITEQAQTLLRLVHRSQTEQLSEEQLEQMEQLTRQRAVTEQQTTVTSESKDVHTVQVNEITHQVVTQATQDINELVQRTIAKQMNTISGKVYQQLERRLELERHRRGR